MLARITLYVNEKHSQRFLLTIVSERLTLSMATGWPAALANRSKHHMARPTARKSNVISMNRFRITSPELPGVTFFSYQDMLDGVAQACAEQKAIAEYIVDRCESALWEALLAWGWDYKSIEGVVANPHAKRQAGYGWPTDYADAA
jgi:hypothetical protein